MSTKDKTADRTLVVPVSMEDLADIGYLLLCSTAAASSLGHNSLTDQTMYVAYPETPMGQVFHDVVWGAQLGSDPAVLTARARLTAYLWSSGMMHHAAEKASLDPIRLAFTHAATSDADLDVIAATVVR